MNPQRDFYIKIWLRYSCICKASPYLNEAWWIEHAGYTLCTNLDKSGANYESRIVYTQVIPVWFVPDLICSSRFVNSQALAGFERTIKGHKLDLHCLWCVYLSTLFVHFGGFLVYSGSFSTQVGWLTISWLVCGCLWWFRRWLRESWIWRIHEYREQFIEIHNLQFICANGAWISDLCESRIVYSHIPAIDYSRIIAIYHKFVNQE